MQAHSGPKAWEQLAVGDVAVAYGIVINNVTNKLQTFCATKPVKITAFVLTRTECQITR